jgi:NarL family two-component system response regulator LiaR
MVEVSDLPIRILIVDDHGMVRFGLRGYLQSTPGLAVAGEAASAEDALTLLESLDIDVVLMDLALPGMSGAEATRLIAQRYANVRVLVLTSFLDDDHILPAIRAGAAGYLLKDIDPDDLVKAVQATYNGQSVLNPQVMSHLAERVAQVGDSGEDPFAELSERELDVLRLLARGLTNHAIAAQLMVSENTVRTHVSNILAKLDLRDRTQAALLALQRHLVPLSDVQPYPCDE